MKCAVSRACVKCGAPGVYQNDLSFTENYPGLYRPASVGRSVGKVCPHCGFGRSEPENLGELKKEEFRDASNH